MSFEDELKSLINRYSLENKSDTPDWILAEFVMNTLDHFNETTKQREQWYGRKCGDGTAITERVATTNDVPSLSREEETLVSWRVQRLVKLISAIDKKGDESCGGGSLDCKCDRCIALDRILDLEEIINDYHHQCNAG